MLDNTKVNANDGSPADVIADGSFGKKYCWSAAESGSRQISFDLGKEYMVDRYMISHASAGGYDRSLNIKEYTFEVSEDGHSWKKVESCKVSESDFSDSDIAPVKARYAILTVDRCGKDNIARIADIEIYGKTIK